MPEEEAVVYEKVYALLTRVCRGVTLQRDVPPEVQRQLVQTVQRGAWQVLLWLAQHRVCVAAFAAAFLDFLRGALPHAHAPSGYRPQRLLLAIAWVRSSPYSHMHCHIRVWNCILSGIRHRLSPIPPPQ